MTQETIDDFYTSLIKSTGCDVDTNGIMTVTAKNKTDQVTLNTNGTDRIVRLPTYANLRDPCPDTTVFFHPLAENLERGKSEVFDMLHRRMVSKLNSVMTITGVGLLTLQLSPQLHTKFNKEQMEIMRMISESNDKSALNWAQIAMHPVLKMPDRLDQWGINIFIKKKGKYKGQEYKRVGVTGFPAYEEIVKGERYYKTEGKDAKMIGRVVDYKTYQQVMEAIFPDIKTIGAYDAGYDGAVAPNLIAFLKAVEQVGSRLNYVSDTLADFFSQVGVEPELSRMDLSWRNTINDADRLASWLRKIPSLEGNAGRPDLRALKEDQEPVREERREEPRVPPRQETRTEKRDDPLPWEDDKRDAPTNKYGLSVSWAKKGGGNVKDLDEDRRRQREAELDEEERRRESLRRQRDEEDRARAERRNRTSSREDDDREARRRERDAEERRARGDDRDDRDSDRESSPVLKENGKLNFSAALRAKPEIARGTRTEEELRERERGSRRRYRDDRDYDRDSRYRGRYRDDQDYDDDDYDDRDYRRRYRDDDRDYRERDRYRDDRDYRSRYRDDRDDRDYRDRYRDDRDDRDYRGRDRGRGSGLRRLGWG